MSSADALICSNNSCCLHLQLPGTKVRYRGHEPTVMSCDTNNSDTSPLQSSSSSYHSSRRDGPGVVTVGWPTYRTVAIASPLICSITGRGCRTRSSSPPFLFLLKPSLPKPKPKPKPASKPQA
ncbi:unnamed protein product [Caenorhabditis auriculariae]|uniref:Uncharacterized protein n=1 Tax=Caenorhabditis auriculariae TaxID=2777116 RepID=A0A8S1H5E5_9PELO|nr:unnamed protein product [Caenorhabditis auriculariae]